ncbi:MAG: ribosome maturation factor RimM [Candidatus Eisenbacteria bacterium]
MPKAARIHLGTFGRVHGLRGEVRLRVSRLLEPAIPGLPRVFLAREDGESRALSIEGARPHGDAFLLKLEGIDDRTGAEALRGAEVEAAREDLEAAGAEGPFVEDLVGLRVETREGRAIGTLEDVLEYPAGDLYKVRGDGAEHLIPAVPAIVVAIDLEDGRMVVDPPPGLLDINRQPVK